MTFDKGKFSEDLIELNVDLEALYYRALDINKRFDQAFSNEVNALASPSTAWAGTNLTKDDALDLVICAKEFTFFGSPGQTEGPRDNLASMARARNLQST